MVVKRRRRTDRQESREPASPATEPAPSTAARPRRKVFRLAIPSVIAVVVFVAALMVSQPGAEPGPQATPEAALRTFFVASGLGDEATLRKVTLPTPDFDLLLGGGRVPAGKADEFRRTVARMEMKRAKTGARIPLPDGRVFTLDSSQITVDHAWIYALGTRSPIELRRVDGVWKVDPRAILETRRREADARRADEARRRAGH